MSFKDNVGEFLRCFMLGFFLVCLVSANTKQIVNDHFLGAFIVGFMISYTWSSSIDNVFRKTKVGKIVYATGAALGTVTSMLVMNYFYGV
jgi:hypothetical protein